MIITKHVAVTNDGRYVLETHPDAAFLAYSPGAEVSDEVVAERGLGEWVAPVQAVRRPSVVVGRNPQGQPTMEPTRIVMGSAQPPAGTVPPGHATASHAVVPAETAEPVANADGMFRGQVVSPPPVAQSQPTRSAAKPTRTNREV